MIIIITCFLIVIGLIASIIYFGFRDPVKEMDYTDPIKLKEEIEKKTKKEDKEYFNNLIYFQNNDIYNAMLEEKKETTYKFYGYYQNIEPEKYRDWFTEKANEYYKKYKINGDKISWE